MMAEVLEQELSQGLLSYKKGKQLPIIRRRLAEYRSVDCIGKCLHCRFRAELAECYALPHILNYAVNFELSSSDGSE